MKKSKKIISLVLAIAMVLLVPVSVISAAPKGYGFRYAGVTVYVHGKASGLIDKMGEPNRKASQKAVRMMGKISNMCMTSSHWLLIQRKTVAQNMYNPSNLLQKRQRPKKESRLEAKKKQ